MPRPPALALPLALLLAACAAEPPAAPSATTARRAIVNGQLESGYPGVGALTYAYPGYGYQGHFCTGTLLSAEWVLTAAHCLTEHDGFTLAPEITMFYVGTDARPTGSGWPSPNTLYQADAFFVHPAYDATYLTSDVALVHLAEPATGVPTHEISSAFLSAVGADVFYVGFGATEGVDHTGGGLKRSTTVPITWIYDDVYSSDYSGTGTCFGDSGGPAFLDVGGQERIIGVNSSLSSCDPATDPSCPADPCQGTAITTRIDAVADWIASVTGTPLPSCTSDPAGLCFCAAACQANGSCDNTLCQTLGCEALYDCLADCADDAACSVSCYASGTTQGKAELDALQVCLSEQCADLTGTEYQSCASASCQAQIETCFPIGVGPLSCEEVYDCLGGCPDGDDACSFGCYEQGTASAQATFDAMQACFEAQCGTLSGDAWQTCAMQQCEAAIDACFPPVYGDATCEAVQDCYGGCADGDNPCLNACFETGTAQAQDQLDAMAVCFGSQCSGLGGDAWVDCVYDKCGAEIDACYPPADCPVTGGGCPAGEACYPTPSGATDCFPSQDKAAGADCTNTGSTLACADGLVCVTGGAGVGECLRMCVAAQHCATDEQCTKPFFSDNDAIGVCTCIDADGDGWCQEADCNDEVGAINPASADTCGDGVDNDCDGQTDETCGSGDAGPGPADAGPIPQDAGGGTGSDAGGPVDPDAGTPPATDGGTSPGVDAGSIPQADAGKGPDLGGGGGIQLDAGAGTPGVGVGGAASGSSSSGCAAGTGSDAGALPMVGLALLALLAVRRRRRALAAR